VSWLVSGEVLHRDSLGSEQLVVAGSLGLMTAGRAIAHSEESPGGDASGLQGVQLWIALPDAHRAAEPSFEHHAKLPVEGFGAARATIFYGSLGKSASPARRFSPALGAQIAFPTAARATLPVDPSFEHAVLLLRGRVLADGVDLPTETLATIAPGSEALVLEGDAGSLALVLGGAPFGEEILMWWNFVARTSDEMATARADWEAGRRFGDVPGYRGARLAAPPSKPPAPAGT
jgi:redox-sensitive bicupin YhaK (pirin superfamily)